MMIHHPHHVRLPTLENTPPKPTRVAWYGRWADGASQAEGAPAISGMRIINDYVDIYAVLDCRQDPATIDAILNSPPTNRST